MKELSAQLGRLFRKIEKKTGTGVMSMTALESFSNTLYSYKNTDWKVFLKEYTDLLSHIDNTKPRFSIIMDTFYRIYRGALKRQENGERFSPEVIQQEIAEIIVAHYVCQKQVVEYGASLIRNRDVILIYDHSTTVSKVLLAAAQNGKRFEVIIARQDEQKTDANIEFCLEHKLNFKVIPTYMLTHIEDTITKVFTGVVTLKNTYKFIMDPGSMQVISEFTVSKKPIYAFLQTSKFSLWEDSGQVHDVNIKEKKLKHELQDMHYEFMSFSHDRVAIDFFDGIVTEDGIFTPDQVKEIFEQKFSERKKLQQSIQKRKKVQKKGRK